jgi:ankyrin repeat protein
MFKHLMAGAHWRSNSSSCRITTKNVELVKSFIGLCDIDSIDSDGNTALHLAAYQKGDCIEIVKLLVGHGAKVDLQNKKRETPYRWWDWTNDEMKNYLKQFEKKINFP